MFDGIPENEQPKIDPLIIDKCLKKFESNSFSELQMTEIMKHTDLDKKIPEENKSVDAIIENLDKMNFFYKQKAPESLVRFAFNFTDFEKFKKPQNEAGNKTHTRHNLIHQTIYILAENDSANDWDDKIKNVFEKNIYKEFIDAIKDD